MVQRRQVDGALLAAAGDKGPGVRRQQEGAGAAQQVQGLRRRGENLRQRKEVTARFSNVSVPGAKHNRNQNRHQSSVRQDTNTMEVIFYASIKKWSENIIRFQDI